MAADFLAFKNGNFCIFHPSIFVSILSVKHNIKTGENFPAKRPCAAEASAKAQARGLPARRNPAAGGMKAGATQRLLDSYLDKDIDRESYLVKKEELLSFKKTLEEQIARIQQTHHAWLEPFSFRPKSPWQRDKSMGGAARRPANSGIGAIVPNRSNLFYQKLLMIESSGGGKEKGLKGKRNCCRLRFLLVPLRGTRIASHSLRPRFARPSLAGKIFAKR